MRKIKEEDYNALITHLEYLGYESDCLRHVELIDDRGVIKVLYYPTSDHYNGIPESMLKIFIKDIDEVISVYNEEKLKGE